MFGNNEPTIASIQQNDWSSKDSRAAPSSLSSSSTATQKADNDGKRDSELSLSSSSANSTPISSPIYTKEKLSMRPSMPEKRKSMRLSLPDEPKETNWLLMVFDPEVSNINEEEW